MGDLKLRIERFLEHRTLEENKRVQVGSIKTLSLLSEQLQNELNNEVNAPFLLGHPFFCFLKMHMKGIVDRLCNMALRHQTLAKKDALFSTGDEVKHMAFVKSGDLTYSLSGDVFPAEDLHEG